MVCTGYVDDARVAALLAGARLLVFPSLYEGFGMPLLEAMQAGVPVVAARAGATPETVGDAGLLVEPGRRRGLRRRHGAGGVDGSCAPGSSPPATPGGPVHVGAGRGIHARAVPETV